MQNLNNARKTVSLIDLKEYTFSELSDMTQYLYGKNCEKMSKDEIIAFLSEPDNETAS